MRDIIVGHKAKQDKKGFYIISVLAVILVVIFSSFLMSQNNQSKDPLVNTKKSAINISLPKSTTAPALNEGIVATSEPALDAE